MTIRKTGSLAQLNRAFDYGSKGYRFESCGSHKRKRLTDGQSLFFISGCKECDRNCRELRSPTPCSQPMTGLFSARRPAHSMLRFRVYQFHIIGVSFLPVFSDRENMAGWTFWVMKPQQ